MNSYFEIIKFQRTTGFIKEIANQNSVVENSSEKQNETKTQYQTCIHKKKPAPQKCIKIKKRFKN